MTLAGYFPKITAVPEGFGGPPHLAEICSVSGCVNGEPEDWIQLWIHNDLFFFNSPDDARRASGDDHRFEIFAYRVLEARFVDGRREDWSPGDLAAVKPLPAGYASIGFDAVSRYAGGAFDCSPLSCNYMWREYPVNKYCLVESLDTATAVAERCSQAGQAEPGPYFVFEVLRDNREHGH